MEPLVGEGLGERGGAGPGPAEIDPDAAEGVASAEARG